MKLATLFLPLLLSAQVHRAESSLEIRYWLLDPNIHQFRISHDFSVVAGVCTRVGVMYAGQLVEEGSAAEVLHRPRHPYTRLLIDSLPGLDRRKPLVGIPGLPPALFNLPPGCPFSSRCPMREAICDEEEPQLRPFGPTQQAACHFPLREPGSPVPQAGAAAHGGAATAVGTRTRVRHLHDIIPCGAVGPGCGASGAVSRRARTPPRSPPRGPRT